MYRMFFFQTSLEYIEICMYVCMVITFSVAELWINRVRLPILLSLSSFAPESLVSPDRFGRPVPRQHAYSPPSGCIWCLLVGLLPLSTTASIYTFNLHRVGPEFIRSHIAYRW